MSPATGNAPHAIASSSVLGVPSNCAGETATAEARKRPAMSLGGTGGRSRTQSVRPISSVQRRACALSRIPTPTNSTSGRRSRTSRIAAKNVSLRT